MGIKAGRKQSAIGALIFAAGYLLVALLFVFPLPRAAEEGEAYEAVWENGMVTHERYAAAYSALVGADEDGILLENGGLRGKIAAAGPFREGYRVLMEGELLDLLTATFDGLSPLERTALFRTFGGTLYFSADCYAFDGDRVFRTAREAFERVALLDGPISSEQLRTSGATALLLHAGAQLEAAALCGTAVNSVTAQAPYVVEGDAVCLQTAGGRRLVAALPQTTELKATYDFCDKGALAPCTALRSAELPFAGNAPKSAGSAFDGRLLWAFGGKLPETLKRVKLTGGVIAPDAFAGCGGLEELDLCGIPAENISAAAFERLGGLVRLHTRKELSLAGAVRTLLPCGCYFYERSQT